MYYRFVTAKTNYSMSNDIFKVRQILLEVRLKDKIVPIEMFRVTPYGYPEVFFFCRTYDFLRTNFIDRHKSRHTLLYWNRLQASNPLYTFSNCLCFILDTFFDRLRYDYMADPILHDKLVCSGFAYVDLSIYRMSYSNPTLF